MRLPNKISIKDHTMDEIMLLAMQATEFPVHVEIGKQTYILKDAKESTFFSLGIAAYFDSLDI